MARHKANKYRAYKLQAYEKTNNNRWANDKNINSKNKKICRNRKNSKRRKQLTIK